MVASRSRRWLSILGMFVAVVVAVGCGTGPTYNDAIGRSQPPGTELPRIPRAPVPPNVDRLPTGGSGTAAPTAFCRDVNDIQALITTLLGPAGGASAANAARALLAKLSADAPAEVRPAVRTLSQIEERVIHDLATSPPDFTDLTTALADPAYQGALQQVIEYAAAHCSVSLTPPTP